jgi:hypothetical protein
MRCSFFRKNKLFRFLLKKHRTQCKLKLHPEKTRLCIQGTRKSDEKGGTDLTISVNPIDEMVKDSVAAVKRGSPPDGAKTVPLGGDFYPLYRFRFGRAGAVRRIL